MKRLNKAGSLAVNRPRHDLNQKSVIMKKWMALMGTSGSLAEGQSGIQPGMPHRKIA